jgi:transcriptional regulator with PAS, ATPase and Fis domain
MPCTAQPAPGRTLRGGGLLHAARNLFESELFGHERGAFTGADRRKPGLIEAASGGTIFLDEDRRDCRALQAKLLRVLETGRFRRVGGTTDLRTDARVVAATNRDLPRMVQEDSSAPTCTTA